MSPRNATWVSPVPADCPELSSWGSRELEGEALGRCTARPIPLPPIPPARPFAGPHFSLFSLESKERSQSKTVTCFTLFLIYFTSYLLNLIPQFHGCGGFLLKGINRSGIWGCHRNCFGATASLPASSSPRVPDVVRALASTAEISPAPQAQPE